MLMEDEEKKFLDEVKEEEVPAQVQTQAQPAPAQASAHASVAEAEHASVPTDVVPGDTRAPSETDEEGAKIPESEPEKMLTQSHVNDLIKRTKEETRERAKAEALREMLERYGVTSNDELDGIFGRGQAYDVLNDNYTSQGSQLKEVMAENALLKTKIASERWSDAKAILASKGLEVNEDNIMSELATHPEWRGTTSNAPASDANPNGLPTNILTPSMVEGAEPFPTEIKNPIETAPSVMRKFGTEAQPRPEEDDDSAINKWFGLN